MIYVQVDVQSLLVWVVVGLVAGFLAGRVILGRGLGLAADVVVGILGAVLGGFLASWLGIQVLVPGHPLIGAVLIAFLGAVVLLLVLRLFGLGRRRPREVA
jgi:uncharacterized membrane protein YeaQ/YmgE (transglycosylase-associated protein family)